MADEARRVRNRSSGLLGPGERGWRGMARFHVDDADAGAPQAANLRLTTDDLAGSRRPEGKSRWLTRHGTGRVQRASELGSSSTSLTARADQGHRRAMRLTAFGQKVISAIRSGLATPNAGKPTAKQLAHLKAEYHRREASPRRCTVPAGRRRSARPGTRLVQRGNDDRTWCGNVRRISFPCCAPAPRSSRTPAMDSAGWIH